MKARVIADPPPLPAKCDEAIWSNTTPARTAVVLNDFLGQDSDSYVFLTACRPDELAWENEDGRGLFTRALLNALTGISPNSLDYATLVRKLEDLSESAPESLSISITH